MNILNKYFDNIYVLHIDNEEVQKITPKLNKRSIKVQFFEGVNGHKNLDRYVAYAKTFDTKYENLIKNNQYIRKLNQGSFGHIMSFINILKDAKQKNYKKILILEPDIYFCDNFDNRCKKYLDMEYDLLYFGASQNLFYREETWDYIDRHFQKELKNGYYNAYNTLGTFALAINSTVFNDCIDALIKMEAPTDVSLISIQHKNNKKSIVCYPNIICCDVTHSKTSLKKNQVETMKSLRWNIKYEFEDEFSYKTEINSWYEITLEINSYLPNFTLNILDVNKNKIYPDISADSNRNSFNEKKTVIYFLSKTNVSIIKLNNIFPENTSIKKIDKQYVKFKMPFELLRKNRISEISKYYITNLI